MTNGEKFKKIFKISPAQVDEGELYAYAWLPNHDAIEIPLEWWNAEYIEPTTKNDLGVDAVSREAVLDLIADYDLSMGQVVRGIHALPPATPQEPKTGHWMNRGKQGEVLPFYMRYECSICGETADKSNYCPNCGAKMVEPQESEDT